MKTVFWAIARFAGLCAVWSVLFAVSPETVQALFHTGWHGLVAFIALYVAGQIKVMS